MDTETKVETPEDTSKSIQVDDRVILTVDKEGIVKYPTPITGKDLYEIIDRAEHRINRLYSEATAAETAGDTALVRGKKEDAHRETLHLFMAVTLFEISRLRGES